MPLLALLVWVIVVALFIWAIYAVLGAFQTPEPWRTLILVIVALLILMLVVLPALQSGKLPSLL